MIKKSYKFLFLITLFCSIANFASAQMPHSISLKNLILEAHSTSLTSENLKPLPITLKSTTSTEKNGAINLSFKNNETNQVSTTRSKIRIQDIEENIGNQIQVTIPQLSKKLENPSQKSTPRPLTLSLSDYFSNQDINAKLVKNNMVGPFYSAGIYQISQPEKEDIWVVLQSKIVNRKDQSLISIYTSESDAVKQYNKPFYG